MMSLAMQLLPGESSHDGWGTWEQAVTVLIYPTCNVGRIFTLAMQMGQ